jgi:hypothetical protein
VPRLTRSTLSGTSRSPTCAPQSPGEAEVTPFLQAAKDKGCIIQVGSDMLFEMIPACLEFFGFGSATPEELRTASQLP